MGNFAPQFLAASLQPVVQSVKGRKVWRQLPRTVARPTGPNSDARCNTAWRLGFSSIDVAPRIRNFVPKTGDAEAVLPWQSIVLK
jgi:hypothetical protein